MRISLCVLIALCFSGCWGRTAVRHEAPTGAVSDVPPHITPAAETVPVPAVVPAPVVAVTLPEPALPVVLPELAAVFAAPDTAYAAPPLTPPLRLGELATIALAHAVSLRVAELEPLQRQAQQLEQQALFNPVLEVSARRRVERDVAAFFIEPQTATVSTGRAALTQRLPDNSQVTVEATGRETRISNLRHDSLMPLFDPERHTELSLTIVKPLLRGAWRENAEGELDLARLSEQEALARLARLRGELLAEIERQYWLLARCEIEEQLARRSLARARLILAERLGAQAAGEAPEIDVLSARENRAAREADLLRLLERRRAAADGLTALVYGEFAPARLRSGDLVLQTAGLDYAVPVPAEDTAALAAALRNRAEVPEAQQAYARALLQERLAQNATLPQLDAYGTYGYGRFTSDQGLAVSLSTSAISLRGANEQTVPLHPWEIGATFSIPIGASPDEARAVLAALAREEQRLQLATLENRIAREVRQAVRALRTGLACRELRETALTDAAGQLRAAWGAYRLGRLTTVQFLQHSQHFDEAYAAALQAQYELACAVTEYYRAAGLLLPAYLDGGGQ